MKVNLDDLFNDVFKPQSKEEIEQGYKDSYETANINPENMSYWFPKIQSSTTQSQSILKLPNTKVEQINFEWWKWLQSDNYKPDKVKEFNQYLLSLLDDFENDNPLFIKSGIFSNKFIFSDTQVNNRETLGEKFLSIYYASMCLGPSNTNEIVFREMVEDKENKPTIYKGMPLHTEFRVFYDFDNQEVVGVANYWHPEEMTRALRDNDAETYKSAKDELISEYNQYKQAVVNEVHQFMKGVEGLFGKWSIDVMKNADEFWIIDMARMERSALVNYLEEL